ncbi:ABC transporter permease [Fulvivirga lutimaris]|uniref:ABC transporter permease n=1 Tax=Fulvivirga lutimaris TaxID=1819566 RepID=UPI0012BC3664|nr:ABC transporter permease [Fulvivirga lutimaris]MTI39386.1 ABC transporter permease [Fulvivirga lutimaris]
MLKNYFYIAFRNLTKSKVFSLINIAGLALGLCCALLIALWVADEYSVDKFHSKKDRIYSVVSEIYTGETSLFWSSSPGLLAQVMNADVSGVEVAVKSSGEINRLIINGASTFNEYGMYVDSAFLSVFDFPLVQGNKEDALTGLNSIVLTETLATKIFGNTDVVGKMLKVRDQDDSEFIISGILKDLPSNSSIEFDYLLPYQKFLIDHPHYKDWGNFNDVTYVLLAENTSKRAVEAQFPELIKKYTDSDQGNFHLVPTADFYLKTDLSNGLAEGGRIVYVRIFIVIGFIILIIGCINFMNLSSARAGKRSKEVGVRKAVGASRKSLVFQFLGESIFISLISIVLAVSVADILMPAFNSLTGKELSIPFFDPLFIISVLGVTLITGVLAGIYPAVYLSSFQSAKVLKGIERTGGSLTGFRRALVIFQFVLSISFISITIIANQQLSHVLSKDLGLKKDNIVYFPIRSARKNAEAFRNDLLNVSGVKSVAYSNFNPTSINNSTSSPQWSGKAEDDQNFFHVIQTDYAFLETFDIELLQGKNLPQTVDTTLAHFLVNEAAARVMGMIDPVGQEISVWGDKGVISGLMRDFHHQSLFQSIEPVIVYQTGTAWRGYAALDSDNNKEAIAGIERVFKKYEQEYPFEYGFVDQEYERQYTSVDIVGKLTAIFSSIAILVSCLGLFGLASYMTEQRKRETGVRKVFGASIWQLTNLFSKQFLRLVLISFIISTPVAYYLTDNWLQRFAYRIDSSILPFALSGIAALLIAFITVSYHIIKAAKANPVDSLRYE